MPDAAPSEEAGQPARQPSFHVRRWLTELTGLDSWEIVHTRTRRQVEFVTSYSASHGAVAEVLLHALQVARQPSWELLAQVGDRQVRVVIPARTHLEW